MTQFIENGKLNIGSSKKNREKNLGHLLEYIYRNFSLDHDVMKDIYKDVKVPVDFDYEDSISEDYDEYYRNNLNFVGYYQEDDEYVFRYDGEHFDPENFDNNPLITKVHEFLQSNTPEELLKI